MITSNGNQTELLDYISNRNRLLDYISNGIASLGRCGTWVAGGSWTSDPGCAYIF